MSQKNLIEQKGKEICFTKENFKIGLSIIGFKINKEFPFSVIIDDGGNRTNIQIKKEGITFNNREGGFNFFFEFEKNKMSLNEQCDCITVFNEDKSIFLNFNGF